MEHNHQNWRLGSDRRITTFYLALTSTHENPDDTQAEGYAVGINPSSSNDNIAVWQFKSKEKTNN